MVTEAGFGSDIGMEKFMNIKCRSSGLRPSCVVMVCTIRALKMHGGGPPVQAGLALDVAYSQENLDLVRKGCENLQHHVRTACYYGLPVIVCINKVTGDTDAENAVVIEAARAAGAYDCVVGTHWEHGGAGAAEVAKVVVRACEEELPARTKANGGQHPFRFLYADTDSIKSKIEAIATKTYGAAKVEYSAKAEEQVTK